MGFVCVCVGVVLTFVIILTTCVCSAFININKDKVYTYISAWIVSSICFGVCLTILLFQNGLLNI